MTEEPDTGPAGPEKDAGTKAGRDLLDRMDRYDGLWHGAVQDIIAIEREAAAAALDATALARALAEMATGNPDDDSPQDSGDYGLLERPSEFAARILAALQASRDSTPDPLE